ncbi:spinster family MFS transporter [Sphingopyxis sp. NJF-3]
MSENPALAAGRGSRAAGATAAQTRTMLWILLTVYIFNFLDRQIVNILAEPIKADLGLSDTELGLLAGPAFAVFYALLGIPIARHADKEGTNRVRLIALALAIWSAMTAVCGLAQNFVQLLFARIGVGVGEAGCTPAAHSLITDSVPAEKRSSAIAFYGLGIPIGSLFGLVLGGVVNDLYNWRVALMLVGAPGLILALAVLVFMREPRHHRVAEAATAAPARLPAGAALREIFGSRAFVYILIAASVTAFLGYGKALWTISFFIRSHGLSTTEAGLSMAVVLGLAAAFGTWLGGKAADVFGRRAKRHILSLPAYGMAIVAPLLFLGYHMEDWRVAMALLIVPSIVNSAYYGPAYACVQGLVRPQARAVAASIMLFGQNLIGLGFGPFLFGVLSDALAPAYGEESVRYVLYGAAWLGLVPAFFFWRASLRLGRELKSG